MYSERDSIQSNELEKTAQYRLTLLGTQKPTMKTASISGSSPIPDQPSLLINAQAKKKLQSTKNMLSASGAFDRSSISKVSSVDCQSSKWQSSSSNQTTNTSFNQRNQLKPSWNYPPEVHLGPKLACALPGIEEFSKHCTLLPLGTQQRLRPSPHFCAEAVLRGVGAIVCPNGAPTMDSGTLFDINSSISVSSKAAYTYRPIKEELNKAHFTSSIETASSTSKVHFSLRPHGSGRNYSPSFNQTREQNQSSTRKNIMTKDSQMNVSKVESSLSRASQVSKTYSQRIDVRFRDTLHSHFDPITFKRAVPSHVHLNTLSPICSRPSTSKCSFSLSTAANSTPSSDSTQADRLDRDPDWPTPAEFPFADPQEEPPDYMRSALEIIGSLMAHTLRLEKAAAISRRIRGVAARLRAKE